MSFWTVFGIIILILLVIIWVVHNLYKNGRMPDGSFRDTYEYMLNSGRKTYDNYFTDAIKLYEKTIGYENDDTAKMAISKALKKEEMYAKNELNGRLSKKKLGKAAMNSFVIADIYRFNIAPNQKTAKDKKLSQIQAALFYNKTLNRIVNNPIAIVQSSRTATSTDNELPPEFMIDRAEEFYEDYLKHLTDENTTDDVLVFKPNFDRIRETVRDARVKVASSSNVKKDVAVKNYFSEKSVPNDPQNVHDTQVNNDFKNIFEKVIEKNQSEFDLSATPTLGDIRDEMMKYEFDSETKRERALLILHKFSEGNMNTNLNTTEDQVLLNIWKRIHSPENQKVKDDMKSTLFDSMADSMDINNYGEFKEVCLSGRCDRVLQSLTLVDQDPEISKPVKTTEILRNEVFSKSYRILQDELKKVPPEIGDAYNGKLPQGSDPELEKKVAEFEDNVKMEIEKTIRQDHSNVKPTILESIIKDAVAGI